MTEALKNKLLKRGFTGERILNSRGIINAAIDEVIEQIEKSLTRIDVIASELQMDEYLNEDSLPKLNEIRGLINKLKKG